ncbi:nuclear transport factor 2 family protein [Streptomyces sp. NPDC086777]|uniref:nuclear transport factor 2 family protein n=1 Tax=Streptomyces sp. NPDC086777 TaxID=3154866 RepID=UPI0034509145
MHDSQPRTIAPDDLPEVITRYLAAHRAHDTAGALSAFTDDGIVVDDGSTYRGRAAIERWLDRSATEFTYTMRLTNAQQAGPDRYVATHHLEGDFPGGTVDLHYRFTLRDGLVEHLTIEP